MVVTSELYQYRFSTRGGRLVSAELANYTYTIDSLKGRNVELLPPGSDLLALRLLVGRDTVPLDDWVFVPSAQRLTVDQPVQLVLRATQGGVTVTLEY
ncbi:MAG: YidC/Oxa1 family insertase periplasmic-domain containing protein, partial [SAR324 cluster bacterium]|nr:YidC/Oxa1 family insertase periplasmic-domain containing protein [SAR324 cluster bacterium]